MKQEHRTSLLIRCVSASFKRSMWTVMVCCHTHNQQNLNKIWLNIYPWHEFCLCCRSDYTGWVCRGGSEESVAAELPAAWCQSQCICPEVLVWQETHEPQRFLKDFNIFQPPLQMERNLTVNSQDSVFVSALLKYCDWTQWAFWLCELF